MALTLIPCGAAAAKSFSDFIPLADPIHGLIRRLQTAGAEIVGLSRGERGLAELSWRPAGADPSLDPIISSFAASSTLGSEFDQVEDEEIPVELGAPAAAEVINLADRRQRPATDIA